MDEVASGIPLELHRAYFVAAVVEAAENGGVSVTFVVRDVANDCEPPRVVSFHGPGPIEVPQGEPLILGGCGARGLAGWDGLLDEFRFSEGTLSSEQWLLHGDTPAAGAVGWWRFEAAPGPFRDASPSGNHIEPPQLPPVETVDPRTQALADYCHVLLNSNEFLYTD